MPALPERVVIRKTGSMNRTAALVVAAYILYGPSYYFAMSYTVRPDGVKQHTIFAGIERLFEEGFGYLGVILFFSSVCIPFIKLVGLTWLLIRVRRPSARGLVLRTACTASFTASVGGRIPARSSWHSTCRCTPSWGWPTSTWAGRRCPSPWWLP